MKKRRSESGRGGVRSVGECCRHTCDGEREHASRARQTPTHPHTRHATMPPTPPDGVSPPPTRPGARAVRGTLGEGGGPAAAAALPARAARPHGSAGEAAGPRPSSTHSAHDVERGAAAFEEECFADGMPVVFQVCGGSERVRKRASLERAGVGWHALPLWPRPRPRAMHVASDSVLVGRAWQTCWLVLVAPRRTMRPASPSPGAARVLFQRAAPLLFRPRCFFFKSAPPRESSGPALTSLTPIHPSSPSLSTRTLRTCPTRSATPPGGGRPSSCWTACPVTCFRASCRLW